MDSFDPQAFVNLETTEALTKRPPIDPGDYLATIGEVVVKPWENQEKGKSGHRLVVPLKIDVPMHLREKLGVEQITLSDSCILDINSQSGLDFGVGKNGGLRRYREALDMNKAGEPFSVGRMQGRLVKVKITHDLYKGEVQERPSGVAKA